MQLQIKQQNISQSSYEILSRRSERRLVSDLMTLINDQLDQFVFGETGIFTNEEEHLYQINAGLHLLITKLISTFIYRDQIRAS